MTLTGLAQAVTGTLTIPSEIMVGTTTYRVTAIGGGAFASNIPNAAGITRVVFDDGLQTIGDAAFSYQGGLTSLDFSANHTLTTIGNEAFVGTKITTLVLPATVQTIGDAAFTYAPIKQLTLPAALTHLGITAFASTGLTAVDLSQATQLTTISDHAFENDPLVSVTIPANIQSIGVNAFANNTKMTTLSFAADSQLTTIEDSAFIYDGQLTEIAFPSHLKTIGNKAFMSGDNLQRIIFNDELESIGDNAFTYSGSVSQQLSVNLTDASALTTIGEGAFEYTPLAGEVKFPAALRTIGEVAFAGDQLESVILNAGLVTIGDSAFTYNRLSGELVIPATVMTVGTRAFFGNELTGATLPTGTTMGTDALSYNQITKLTGPAATGALAHEQMVTTFKTAPSIIGITDLFDLHLGKQTTQDLQITDLTNGVTYDGTNFHIPKDTERFTFTWTLPYSSSVASYSGTYTVVLNNPLVKVKDSQIFVGNNWTPSDNFVSAQTTAGSSVPFDQIKVDGDVNSNQPGTYTVTYSYGNDTASTATATITVMKADITYKVHGDQTVIYTGSPAILNLAQYWINLPDGTTIALQNGDVQSIETQVGRYELVLSDTGKQRLAQLLTEKVGAAYAEADAVNWLADLSEATYQIRAATLTGQDASYYMGDQLPDAATFKATAQDGYGTSLAVVADLSAADLTTPGKYLVTLSTSDGQTKTVTLTVLQNQTAFNGHAYTMKVGESAPTVTDFGGVATDRDGQPVALTVDLTGADLKNAGNYAVTLSAADGRTLTVTLIVLPADPTEPTTPVKPSTPVPPTVKPEQPGQPVTPKPDHLVDRPELLVKPIDAAQLDRLLRSGQAVTLNPIDQRRQQMAGSVRHPRSTAAAGARETPQQRTLPQTSERATTFWRWLGLLFGSLGLGSHAFWRRHQEP